MSKIVIVIIIIIIIVMLFYYYSTGFNFKLTYIFNIFLILW